ncbi:MAG: VOC family protein [Gammaproteobacteria bacterium]|nr:VOC family protein [Gammaproteobacteria bacterium]
MLNCHSIEETLAFYQQILQFVIVNKREDNNELQWVHIMNGDITMMLQTVDRKTSEPRPDQNSNINIYFFVNNINDMHHYIKAKYNLVSELIDTDYHMQEFSVTDPEGNTVTVGQKT